MGYWNRGSLLHTLRQYGELRMDGAATKEERRLISALEKDGLVDVELIELQEEQYSYFEITLKENKHDYK